MVLGGGVYIRRCFALTQNGFALDPCVSSQAIFIAMKNKLVGPSMVGIGIDSGLLTERRGICRHLRTILIKPWTGDLLHMPVSHHVRPRLRL